MKPGRGDLKQFVKFMLCSQAAWLADCGVFALAHEIFALHYILCKVLSYTTGAIVKLFAEQEDYISVVRKLYLKNAAKVSDC